LVFFLDFCKKKLQPSITKGSESTQRQGRQTFFESDIAAFLEEKKEKKKRNLNGEKRRRNGEKRRRKKEEFDRRNKVQILHKC
jgi:hypothetical protein